MICEKCGHDHELEKFRENMKVMKFVYMIILVMVILNTINSWASGYQTIIKKLDQIDQKLELAMPAERGKK